MTSTLKNGGGACNAKIRCYRLKGAGVASVLDVQSLIFFIKENWICAITRHHAESNISILLTRNLPIDSGVRQ